MLHAPAQVNSHVAVSVDFIHWKSLFLNGFQMPVGIIHFHHTVVITTIIWLAIQRFPSDFQSHLLFWQRNTGAAGNGMLIVCRKADGLAIFQRHITRQHIGGKACQKVPQLFRLSVSIQHFHFLLAEHIHTVSVAVQSFLVSIQAEPDPVKDGQLVLFHHIGESLVESGFKHHAAGKYTGNKFLLTAHCHCLSKQLAPFQQFFLLAKYCHHDIGLVFFGHLYGLWPHIVVFGVDLCFIVRDVTVE